MERSAAWWQSGEMSVISLDSPPGSVHPPERYWERRRADRAARGRHRPTADGHRLHARRDTRCGRPSRRRSHRCGSCMRPPRCSPAETGSVSRPTGSRSCARSMRHCVHSPDSATAPSPGSCPSVEFFDGLARGLFSSTQYVRWEGAPVYTPEPDVIHEVMGHANCLACPEIAELHRLAGQAIARVETERCPPGRGRRLLVQRRVRRRP